mgnify:CR=1 FL=1
MNYNAKQLNLALVSAADAEWRKNIKDFDAGQEATPEEIGKYFRNTGWQWFLDQYSNGTYTERWRQQPWQSYCGLFVAYCGLHVGRHVADDQCAAVALKRHVASAVLPSTVKLADRSRWKTQPKRPGLIELQPGDIATVGDYKGGAGSHIVLVVSRPSNKEVETIEGNATGRFPDGTTGEGVIRRTRKLDEIHATYRLKWKHYTNG